MKTVAAVAVAATLAFAQAPPPAYRNPQLPVAERVADLLRVDDARNDPAVLTTT